TAFGGAVAELVEDAFAVFVRGANRRRAHDWSIRSSRVECPADQCNPRIPPRAGEGRRLPAGQVIGSPQCGGRADFTDRSPGAGRAAAPRHTGRVPMVRAPPGAAANASRRRSAEVLGPVRPAGLDVTHADV